MVGSIFNDNMILKECRVEKNNIVYIVDDDYVLINIELEDSEYANNVLTIFLHVSVYKTISLYEIKEVKVCI